MTRRWWWHCTTSRAPSLMTWVSSKERSTSSWKSATSTGIRRATSMGECVYHHVHSCQQYMSTILFQTKISQHHRLDNCWVFMWMRVRLPPATRRRSNVLTSLLWSCHINEFFHSDPTTWWNATDLASTVSMLANKIKGTVHSKGSVIISSPHADGKSKPRCIILLNNIVVVTTMPNRTP